MGYYADLIKAKQKPEALQITGTGYYAELLREKYNYDEKQPRDEKGRWTDEGGVSGTTKKQLSPAEKAQKQAERQKRLLKAINELKANEEVVIKDIRDDLKQYGVTNDIALKWGYHDSATGKGEGVCHILYEHGKKDFVGIVNAIVYGQITEYHKPGKRLIIKHNGYKAVLSLNENGKKKVWLLTGYKINPNYKNKKQVIKNAQGEIGEICTQSDPTQYGPTFRRPALVACAISSLTDFFEKGK